MGTSFSKGHLGATMSRAHARPWSWRRRGKKRAGWQKWRESLWRRDLGLWNGPERVSAHASLRTRCDLAHCERKLGKRFRFLLRQASASQAV